MSTLGEDPSDLPVCWTPQSFIHDSFNRPTFQEKLVISQGGDTTAPEDPAVHTYAELPWTVPTMEVSFFVSSVKLELMLPAILSTTHRSYWSNAKVFILTKRRHGHGRKQRT